MESPYFALCKATAPGRASSRTSQRRPKAGELTRYGSGPLVLDEELEAGEFSVGLSDARAARHGKP